MGDSFKYYMFNKPAGIVTAKKDEKYSTVMDYFFENDMSLNPVGRLDLMTEGLLIVTNDGGFGNSLMQPEGHVNKTYYFEAMGKVDEKAISQLLEGVCIAGVKGKAYADSVEIINTISLQEFINKRPEYIKAMNENNLRRLCRNRMEFEVSCGYLTISSGVKHQVKRMIRTIGANVLYLSRVSIGNLRLDDNLMPGQYRELTNAEIKGLIRRK